MLKLQPAWHIDGAEITYWCWKYNVDFAVIYTQKGPLVTSRAELLGKHMDMGFHMLQFRFQNQVIRICLPITDTSYQYWHSARLSE